MSDGTLVLCVVCTQTLWLWTHPKWLTEGPGTAVQWVWDGDQCRLHSAACCTIVIVILTEETRAENNELLAES